MCFNGQSCPVQKNNTFSNFNHNKGQCRELLIFICIDTNYFTQVVELSVIC